MEKILTVSIFTENKIGILNRITTVFTRQQMNIDSITASETEVKNVYRYTIVLRTTKEQINKVISLIEKLIDVLKVFVHEDEEIVHQEIALYKIRTDKLSNHNIENVIRNNNARIVSVDSAYLVIEKTGHKSETQSLFNELEIFGVLEFVRSGRVAVTKPMKELSTYIKELETN